QRASCVHQTRQEQLRSRISSSSRDSHDSGPDRISSSISCAHQAGVHQNCKPE
ncbi:unnamed protein product, partial [Musa hybrid cultivar]